MTTTDIAPVRDEIVEYSETVRIGLEARLQMDSGRYILGDLAILVKSHYGDDKIGEFADDVNVEVKRITEYRTVCKYYPPQIREQIKHLDVTYSHLREAMRLDDLEASLDMLYEAHALMWRVKDIANAVNEIQGKPVPPPPVFEGTLSFRVENGRVWVQGLEGVAIPANTAYRVTVRAL